MRRSPFVVALIVVAGPLGAQQLTGPDVGSKPVQASVAVRPAQSLSVNPIGIAAGFYSAEFERRVSTNATLSIGGSYFDLGDGFAQVSYLAGDLRGRFYPRRALDGLSIGGSVGVIRTGTSTSDPNGGGGYVQKYKSGVTLGTTVEHSWLLGERENFMFSLGGGFKRVILFGGKEPNVETFYPTLRTSFGVLF
ncbi:MAG TPA: hypothetical protein VFJ78_04015 [Gaiellaceae bacterium]|nr:hypothetical protein [Gaiellaceae bacterium]